MRDAGAAVEEDLVLHVPFGRRSGYEAALRLLRGDRPDAVFVASDEQALGVLRAVSELSLRCPDDLAIASFDGIPAAAYATPALTTMAQPFEQMGQAAVEALLAQIGGADPADSEVVLPVTLTRRGSCGCDDPPGGDSAAGSVAEVLP
jgi:LacI family transcriptional regulator